MSGEPSKMMPLIKQEEGEQWYAKLASSYLIFLIVTAIVLAFVTAIFITNTVYYDKINKNKGCSGAVTESEANILFWLNLILAVISGIFFLAAVVLAFIQYEKPEWTEKYTGRLTYTPGKVPAAGVAAVQPYARRVQQRAALLGQRARAGAEKLGQGARLRGGAALVAARNPSLVNNQRDLQNKLAEIQRDHADLQVKHRRLQNDHANLQRDADSVAQEVGRMYRGT